MGLLRVFFAISVLIFHSGSFFGYNIVTSQVAVFSFFIISGFYMGLILEKKYANHKRLFITNRFLRIYPLYLLMFSITLLFTLGKFSFHIGLPDNAIRHYFTYSSYGSDISFFFDILNLVLRNVTLIFTSDYFLASDKTGGYLLIPQAWTLQVELLFYLLIPFVILFSKKLFILFFGFYLLLFFGFILPHDLLSHLTLTFAFLTSLLYFLLGVISYRYIYKSLKKKQLSSYVFLFVSLFFLTYVLLYEFVPIKVAFPFLGITDFPYYILFVVCTPFLFLFTSRSVLDRFIGELSYPIYLIHMFFIKLLSNVSFFRHDSNYKTIAVLTLTIVFSILIVRYFEVPIDRFRQKRIEG